MTINDIARICGVSKGTVNRALHNKPGINLKTKEKILAVVAEYGFSPDYRAKSLATGKTNTIGLLLPNIENPAFAVISTLIEREFWQQGYLLNLALSNDDAVKEERYLQLFINRKIDGLVIFPVNREIQSLKRVIDMGIPLVIVLNNVPVEASAVLLDERKAFASITRHVLSQNHRNILYLDGYRKYTDRYNDYINRERYAGFMQALDEYGLGRESVSVREFEPRYYDLEDLGPLEEYFSRRKTSAVICFHDRIAIWLMMRLQRAGFRLPDDVSITGFDDILELQYIKPRLTTLRNPFPLVAHRAIQLLLEQIGGNRGTSRLILDTELIIRESCSLFKEKT
jgi:DNA-binding LacI/PurR family transcriptional regulator